MSPKIAKHDATSFLPETGRDAPVRSARRLAVSLNTPRYANVAERTSDVVRARLGAVCSGVRIVALRIAALGVGAAAAAVTHMAAWAETRPAGRASSLEWLDDRQLRDIGLERIELPCGHRIDPLGF